MIERNAQTRAGLLATQGIRGGGNRTVLERIGQSGDIFMAWSDHEWILDGAAVNVSIIGFTREPDGIRRLDGRVVAKINSDLSVGVNASAAAALAENTNLAYMGDTKGGAFDIQWTEALPILRSPNPNGKTNNDVLRPWVNGLDVTRRARSMWIVDFGCGMPRDDAALYEAPFRLVEERVYPERKDNRRVSYAKWWWLHVEPRPAMRDRPPKARFIATPNLTKHRLFAFLNARVLPDHQLIVFARDDDYFFGVLHSSIHELWALRMGTQLEDRPRYTPTTCFETFPLPWAPGSEPVSPPPAMNGGTQTPPGDQSPSPGIHAGRRSTQPPAINGGALIYERISNAARQLNEQRERWLNPPEWVEPIARAVDAEDDFADVPEEARGLIRQSAIMTRAAKDAKLKKRTLTNLYNERPTWLKLAHEQLDRAVLAAYAATDPDGDWSEDWSRVWVDTGAGQPLPDDHELTDLRKETDQRVLANLLRINLQRAEKR